MTLRTFKSPFLLCGLLFASTVARPAENAVDADKKALAKVQVYVGGWKGVGNGKDTAVKGMWNEEGEWAWEFKDGRAALALNTPEGKFFKAAKLQPAAKAGELKFTSTLPDGKTEEYTGSVDKSGELVLTASAQAEGRPARITISQVAKGDQLLVFYEKKGSGTTFRPFAEVGYTRKGSGFGKQQDERECVVTGGKGTTPVTFQGKTYYVCCSGCKQAFLDNPEKELADYKKRKEEEKAAQTK